MWRFRPRPNRRELIANDAPGGFRGCGARQTLSLFYHTKGDKNMSIMEKITEKARKSMKHIVLAEGTEERNINAASLATQRGIAKITLIGNPDEVKAAAKGVDLTGDRLIGVGIVGPGLPQVGPRQEQLRDYFEQTRGSGFDYAYRYPGMNKVLQAAGRVIRTPRDKGVVLLIDNRFAMPDYRRLMPPHWSHLKMIYDTEKLERELWRFWEE